MVSQDRREIYMIKSQNNFRKLLYISFTIILTITHYACEDDPILEPNSSDEEYYGSSYGTLIDKERFNSTIENPLIF